eukprot:5291760-Amphidinium_carterae.1
MLVLLLLGGRRVHIDDEDDFTKSKVERMKKTRPELKKSEVPVTMHACSWTNAADGDQQQQQPHMQQHDVHDGEHGPASAALHSAKGKERQIEGEEDSDDDMQNSDWSHDCLDDTWCEPAQTPQSAIVIMNQTAAMVQVSPAGIHHRVMLNGPSLD